MQQKHTEQPQSKALPNAAEVYRASTKQTLPNAAEAYRASTDSGRSGPADVTASPRTGQRLHAKGLADGMDINTTHSAVTKPRLRWTSQGTIYHVLDGQADHRPIK